ncbi:flagellar export chaperone FliS [Rubrivivax gelatinosus]|uniref:Flagellar secretion chaperone FliS n=1 Tax=Rubrivivax gelatinosus TaxID=28068 RepID=A0ABS1DZ05_RUBGE|nr:flagellar export chaperone FliS [Rubrivivax gelatinosus]MBK1715332.1 flagellar export chaperone FliS [Rubrivivax gelatinosus]
MIQDAYHSYHAVDLGARTAQASPVQLVLILTDGLIEELARARAHIVGRRYEAKARSLDKCVNILNGLSSALDFDQGGDIVQNLERLYDFCAQQLYKAGQQLEPKYIDEVVGLLQTLRNGWQGLQARHG